MDSLPDLISQLGPEIEDPEEETFLLYSQPMASQNLGFIDPKARSIDVAINQRDFTIHQSPGILSSSRAGGTTGAVLWKINPLFAEWLSSPSNPLFLSRALSRSSSLIELGCGISPLNALALRPRIARYVLTDQPYVLKLLQQNIDANPPPFSSSSSSSSSSYPSSSSSSSSRRAKHAASPSPAHCADISFRVLDWETDQVSAALTGCPATTSFDALVACDCVFNYALIQPLVQTCADVCRLRTRHKAAGAGAPPCVAVIAQQLRNDDVFTCWLAEFRRHFRVWRFPEEMLPEGLRPAAGFVIHVGLLRDAGE
ncbi:Diaminohydroxyphosphoribosylamino-pyrimidine deaminase [Escovopsis weberi]|uniref:Diaminohydroxyphosphoribosylamino-pyrimidine deaminase n=1 Tax=Escovopsis weberi TaxID=150374 RepID=A0A0M8MRM9_ESCWE|nr:Diaminohydroxyphosphoribosylamino-pyrimidine deaminase [Escovopsis weberi]